MKYLIVPEREDQIREYERLQLESTFKNRVIRKGIGQWYWEKTSSIGCVLSNGPFLTKRKAMRDMEKYT